MVRDGHESLRINGTFVGDPRELQLGRVLGAGDIIRIAN